MIHCIYIYLQKHLQALTLSSASFLALLLQGAKIAGYELCLESIKVKILNRLSIYNVTVCLLSIISA